MAKIIPVTLQNFETEISAEAEKRPVVLTFASSQIPECASYNQMLETLANELDFSLGEVNLDETDNMAFMDYFQIRSLPFVVVLSKGEIADAIQGRVPQDELKKRLSKFFVSEEESARQTIEDAVAEGNFSLAKPLILAELAKKADDHLQILLAKCELGLDAAESAKEILQKIPETSDEYAQAKSLLDLMDLLVEAAKTDAVEGSAEKFRNACKDAARKDYRSALEGLFQLTLSDAAFRDGIAQKSMLVLFSALGPKDPLTWEYRNKLNTFLFI